MLFKQAHVRVNMGFKYFVTNLPNNSQMIDVFYFLTVTGRLDRRRPLPHLRILGTLNPEVMSLQRISETGSQNRTCRAVEGDVTQKKSKPITPQLKICCIEARTNLLGH